MVVAKNEEALAGLVRQFKGGGVRKEYLALVHGRPARDTGRIETLIGRSRHNRKQMSARPARGRVAVTHFRLLEAFPEASLLLVRIETGRTHQIRVHMAHLGFPVVGDRQYGRRRVTGPRAPRQMLHARHLALAHPRTGVPLRFSAPLPEDLRALLDTLRASADAPGPNPRLSASRVLSRSSRARI
jgi:23S rRNA pseudouridine1911/1915/1917 synthase